MEPSLSEKDILLVNKLSYKSNEPERFDLIVFPDKNGLDIEYVKRIIALPGETVQIMDGIIYINAQEFNENYGLEDQIYDIGDIGFPIALSEDEYFVLGDNRNDSIDSRYASIGIINIDDIIGKVIFRVYPFNEIGILY